MDYLLHKWEQYGPYGEFLSPDAVIAGEGLHLPIEIKFLDSERRKKLVERGAKDTLFREGKKVAGWKSCIRDMVS